MIPKMHEIAFRGAVALSNAGASLMLAGTTDAMSALNNALSILHRMHLSSLEKPNNNRVGHEELTASVDLSLEDIESKIQQVNRHLSLSVKLPSFESFEKSLHVPIRDLDGSSIRTLLQLAKTNLKNSYLAATRNFETRPLVINNCSCDPTSHTESDLVTVICLFNYGLSLVVHTEQGSRTVPDDPAEIKLRASRRVFLLSLNIIGRMKRSLEQSQDCRLFDWLQSSVLLIFVWSMVLAGYHQTTLLLMEEPEDLALELLYEQRLDMLEQTDELLSILDRISGSENGSCIHTESAAAA